MSDRLCGCRGCGVAHKMGIQQEQARIIALLEDRAQDMESCTRKDGCNAQARIVRVCIDDITYKHKEGK